MRRTDSGAGAGKAIIALLFLGAVAFFAIKVIPVYVHSYELQDYIRQQTPFWLTQHSTGEGIQDIIMAKAEELDLPLRREQVKVEATGNRVSVSIDYTVPVDLKVYTLQLHFTPSAENRAL